MIITQFQTDPTLINMMERHHAWHTFPNGAHGFPSRPFDMGTPGSGRNFFQFHHGLMKEFFSWNNVHHAAGASDLTAWASIPLELKVPETGWPNPGFGPNLEDAETSIKDNMPPFADDDALGIFVETTVHNWIHGAVAAAPAFNLSSDEAEIIRHLHSPQSTWFYKIHGLVDYWWNRFVNRDRMIFTDIKRLHDIPTKTWFKESHKDVIETMQKTLKDVKEEEKHVVEGPGMRFGDVPDPFQQITTTPEMIKHLLDRITQLESRIEVKKSPFIQPFMRPNVGESIMRAGEEPAKE